MILHSILRNTFLQALLYSAEKETIVSGPTKNIHDSAICEAIHKIHTQQVSFSYARMMSDEYAEELNSAFQEVDSEKYHSVIQSRGGNNGNPYLSPDSVQLGITTQSDNAFLAEAFLNSELSKEILSQVNKILAEILSCSEVASINNLKVYLQHFASQDSDFHLDEKKGAPIRATYSLAGSGTLFAKKDLDGIISSIENTPRGHVAFFDKNTAVHARPQPTKDKRVNIIFDVHPATLKPGL